MTSVDSKENILPLEDSQSASRSSTLKRTRGAATANDRGEREKDREPSGNSFYQNLQYFHESRNTPITRLPKINGREVDLQMLYKEVTSRGGWLKVNIRNEWDELTKIFGSKDNCVNASVVLKSIYTRYLDKYERIHFLGEDPDKLEEQDDDGRPSKKYVAKNCNNIPMVYNEKQHRIPEHMRAQHKMSTDLYASSEYDKLVLSLLSPLPNEQDFAINVCTLMANEANHTLKINKCPKLLDALLAHAGVYCHFSVRELFHEVYAKTRKHSQQSFWVDCLSEKDPILDLSYDDYFQSSGDKFMDGNSNIVRPPLRLGANPTPQDGVASTADDLKTHDFRKYDFLSLGRSLGTQDYIGQRVLQIASIIRNLSFFEENISTLASNRTFIRFLVMASNIRWANIHHMALDVCGNIAPDMELADPTSDDLTRCLMGTVCEGIESQDRGVIISCLEILYKLCQNNKNKKFLHTCLDQSIYNQMCLYLSLNDIMLLLYTLECIYALSSLGARECSSLIQVRGIIGTLVSLITVEGQSYGADGCIQMRVVETVPGNMLPLVAQNIANIANLQNAAIQIQSAEAIKASEANIKLIQQQEAEQFASAWLSATLESAPAAQCRVDTQELYKMYITASQKHSRNAVVTNTQFSRIVRSVFGSGVGPTWMKTENGAGPEANKLSYVSIRIRATPLPIQVKPQMSSPVKAKDTPLKKQKKKLKLKDGDTPVKTTPAAAASPAPAQAHEVKYTPPVQAVTTSTNPSPLPAVKIKTEPEVASLPQSASVVIKKTVPTPQPQAPPQQQIIGNVIISHTPATPAKSAQIADIVQQQVQVTSTAPATASATQSSLIKSLLANKVAQRQQKQKELQLQQQPAAQMQTPIKLTTTTINALVNNTLMQSTPVKVGQTTIKPIGTTIVNDKKLQMVGDSNPSWDPVPPLAPLSSGCGAVVRQIVVSGNNDDSSSTSGSNHVNIIGDGENSGLSFEGLLMPKAEVLDDDSSKDSVRSNQVIISNQMLVDLLDKKALDPPTGGVKRRIDDDACDAQMKKFAVDTTPKPTASKNAANLYAEMAASILNDEDLDEPMAPPPVQTQTIMAQQVPDSQKQIITVPVNLPRQLIMNHNAPGTQVIFSQPSNTLVTQSAPVTIKTEQSVPMIIQKQGQPQQLMQPIMQQAPQTTQYMLATNPQGQTYLVAQPPPPQQQTLLVTQAPQTAGGPTKTFILVQQQGAPGQQQVIGAPNTPQKVIMTAPNGQQMIVTQMTRPVQQHPTIIMNSGSSNPQTIQISQPVSMAGPSLHQSTIMTQFPNIPPSLKIQQTTVPAIQAGPSKQMPGKPSVSIVAQTVPISTPIAETKPLAEVKPQVIITNVVESPAEPAAPVAATQSMVAHTQKVQQIVKTVPVQPQPQVIQAHPQPQPQPMLQIKKEPITAPPAPQSTWASGNPSTQIVNKVVAEPPAPSAPVVDEEDLSWLWICDWRNCPRKKFKSLNEVYRHACMVHCPEHLDPTVEIYCQWGCGPGLCDGVPRKRFSLMTHLLDRHCTVESFKAAVQRRLTSGIEKKPPAQPVTIIKNAAAAAAANAPPNCEGSGTASPALSTSSSSSLPSAASAAMHAIKRHNQDFINPKELMNRDSESILSISSKPTSVASNRTNESDLKLKPVNNNSTQYELASASSDENEGPVTKSIRLTSALILRNLVTHNATAKKYMLQYEPHLAGVALSNVESSGTISQILYELNN